MTISGLRDKSIHDLRAIAQTFGVKDIFSKDQRRLIQDIELKTQAMVPKAKDPIPKPEYDARLMTRPPAKMSTEESILSLLEIHIRQGLRVTFPDPERWEMYYEGRTDTGNMRMPLRVVLGCAERVMR
jgi:hypothetical protein